MGWSRSAGGYPQKQFQNLDLHGYFPTDFICRYLWSSAPCHPCWELEIIYMVVFSMQDINYTIICWIIGHKCFKTMIYHKSLNYIDFLFQKPASQHSVKNELETQIHMGVFSWVTRICGSQDRQVIPWLFLQVSAGVTTWAHFYPPFLAKWGVPAATHQIQRL